MSVSRDAARALIYVCRHCSPSEFAAIVAANDDGTPGLGGWIRDVGDRVAVINHLYENEPSQHAGGEWDLTSGVDTSDQEADRG